MPDQIIDKMEKMTPAERLDFVKDLKDGGKGFKTEPPTLESKESVSPEKEWEEETAPPAEVPPERDEGTDLLSLDLNTIPEEYRGVLQKAQKDYDRAKKRAEEKERGADKKFREAADRRREVEDIIINAQKRQPQAQTQPQKPWYERHGLKIEDAQVFRDFWKEEVAPYLNPFFEDQVKTKEEMTLKDMRTAYNEESGFPNFADYETEVKKLCREVPGMVYEEAYRILAFPDIVKRSRENGGKREEETKLRQDQSRREKEHHFEDSRPRLGSAKPQPPKVFTPANIPKYIDQLKTYDPSGKAARAFMESLEEDRSRR